MIGRLGLIAVIGALLLPGTSEATGLVRLTDRDDLFGWEAIGRVELGKRGGYCTGSLIAPNLVLTAAHCMFDQKDNARPVAQIKFRAGYRDGTSIAESNITRYAVADGYDPTTGPSFDNVRNDLALLELETPIPTSTANPFAVHDRPIRGQEISVVSYGQGRDNALSWQKECNILNRAQGIIVFNCDVTFGSSGAPVFTDGDYHAQIVSVVVSVGTDNSGKKIAFGMHLPPVLADLKRKLRAMPRGFSEVGTSSGAIRSGGAKFAKP